jgi:hypothetical protein
MSCVGTTWASLDQFLGVRVPNAGKVLRRMSKLDQPANLYEGLMVETLGQVGSWTGVLPLGPGTSVSSGYA